MSSELAQLQPYDVSHPKSKSSVLTRSSSTYYLCSRTRSDATEMRGGWTEWLNKERNTGNRTIFRIPAQIDRDSGEGANPLSSFVAFPFSRRLRARSRFCPSVSSARGLCQSCTQNCGSSIRWIVITTLELHREIASPASLLSALRASVIYPSGGRARRDDSCTPRRRA